MQGVRRLLLVAALVAAFPVLAGAQQPEPRQVTLNAEVIDLSCKVAHDLSGPDHRMCAQVCSDQGVPLALLGPNGRIYIPVSEGMPGATENSRLRPFAEQRITVTGRVLERGGMNAILIEEIREG